MHDDIHYLSIIIDTENNHNEILSDQLPKIVKTLSVRLRIPSVDGHNSVQEVYNFVLKPLLLQLVSFSEEFPFTIVYCKLQ